MKIILFILLLFGQQALPGQTSLPTFTSAKKDTLAFLQFLPVEADCMLAYSEESYWWSDIENFKLLVRTGKVWTTWTYYKKWKNSGDMYNNKGKKKPMLFERRTVVDSLSVKELFDSLALVNFWALSIDSLNETRGYDVSDVVNYKFQLESATYRQVLESYAPEYYIEKYPDMQQRIQFVQAKEIFRRWWKRYTASTAML